MENQVIMSLEDYTNLITENVLLRAKMASMKQRAETRLEGEVKASYINGLGKDKVISYIEEKNKNAVLNALFDYNSSWFWESISKEVCVVTAEEAKDMAYAIVMKCLNDRLADINSAEE